MQITTRLLFRKPEYLTQQHEQIYYVNSVTEHSHFGRTHSNKHIVHKYLSTTNTKVRHCHKTLIQLLSNIKVVRENKLFTHTRQIKLADSLVQYYIFLSIFTPSRPVLNGYSWLLLNNIIF